jgi:hypothetical protein
MQMISSASKNSGASLTSKWCNAWDEVTPCCMNGVWRRLCNGEQCYQHKKAIVDIIQQIGFEENFTQYLGLGNLSDDEFLCDK